MRVGKSWRTVGVVPAVTKSDGPHTEEARMQTCVEAISAKAARDVSFRPLHCQNTTLRCGQAPVILSRYFGAPPSCSLLARFRLAPDVILAPDADQTLRRFLTAFSRARDAAGADQAQKKLLFSVSKREAKARPCFGASPN